MKTLRSILLFALIAFAAPSLFAGPAFANITSLTESQVKNVCGPDLKTENGHSGCTKKCANGTSTCIYDCSQKTGDCNGLSVGLVSTTPAGPKWPDSLLIHPTDAMMQGGGGSHHHQPVGGGTGPTPPTGTGPTIPVDPDPPVIY